jgi:prepilin-type processing-associated H-X9-DG protein
MKPRPVNQNTVAMTLTEVVVIIAVLAVLAVLFLPVLAISKHKRNRIGCVSNLRQIGIAYKVWADDNGGKYPMQISVTNGGAMELVATGNVVATFQIMSNVLSDPVLLSCPEDGGYFATTNFSADFTARNISYFVGLDAMDTQPQTLLSGDDNLVVNGTKARSGILNLHTNDSLAWTGERHGGDGNIGLADGSVQELNSAGLTATAGLATNRLAIP